MLHCPSPTVAVPTAAAALSPAPGADFDGFGKVQRPGHVRLERADRFVAFKHPGHLGCIQPAQFQHLRAPALVFHVKEQHAGGVGDIRAVHAR